jgi:hypothetical protein
VSAVDNRIRVSETESSSLSRCLGSGLGADIQNDVIPHASASHRSPVTGHQSSSRILQNRRGLKYTVYMLLSVQATPRRSIEALTCLSYRWRVTVTTFSNFFPFTVRCTSRTFEIEAPISQPRSQPWLFVLS